MNKNLSRLTKKIKFMKFAYIYIFCAFTQMGLSQAEDLDFFEKKYESIISGVKPIGEYSDPDSYYTAIASKLGIFGKAYYAVFQKFGWSKGPNKTHSAKLTRAEGAGRWEIMVVQVSITPETKKPDMSTLKTKLVFLYDDGKVQFPEVAGEDAHAEQDGAGQPATAPESKPEGDAEPQPESEGRSR